MVSYHLSNRWGAPNLHLIDFLGMFCYSGLTADQVQKLKEKYHLYLTKDGRISIAGITTGNVKYIANAIADVTQ